MEATLELSVSSELHAHDFVEQQADEIERLRHRAALIPNVGHGGMRWLVAVLWLLG